MAKKYELISQLYDRTCKTVVANPQSWQNFLRSACYNYRLRFDEQLLVYAQRPDATAILEIERWNERFGRWVNQGARGIAVFEDENRSRQRLKHYFDISDTHAGFYARTVPIWEMNESYTEEIIEALEAAFRELEDKQNIESAVLSAAKNATEDNLPDYLEDLLQIKQDSFLEELDDENVKVLYQSVVTNSVAYMMFSRLGLDTTPYFDRESFAEAVNFNTPDTLNALGIATSDIAEMGLNEISRTILERNRRNRTFARLVQPDYNVVENTPERSDEYERDHLHNAGGLSSARSDLTEAAGSDLGTARRDETEVPQGASQSPVLQSADEMRPDGASGGNRTQSHRDGGDIGPTDGEAAGRNRATQSDGYDALGAEDEQHPQRGTGSSKSGSDFRLEHYDRSSERRRLPFFGNTEQINEILKTTPHLRATKDEIRAFLEIEPDDASMTEYIRSIFNNDLTELTLSDGERYGYKTYQNVLHLWKGEYSNRTAESHYDWGKIAQHFEGMRLIGELTDEVKPLPSIEGQTMLMESAGEEITPAFSFSQEIIDRVLTRGSNVAESKMRIYEQFQKSLSKKENVDFLKEEYGIGGVSPVIIGTNISEQHDAKGIQLSLGYDAKKPHIILKWDQVEQRISELIQIGRYLNPKEKEQHPDWLSQRQAERAELAERQKTRDVLSTAPSEQPVATDTPYVTETEAVYPAEQSGLPYDVVVQKLRTEEPEHTEERYEYHLGDKVYLDAGEYEILSVDDERVMLYDTQFPLFHREEKRADFDRMVAENPLNDHLKALILPPEEKAVQEEDNPQNSTKSVQEIAAEEYRAIKGNNPDSIVLYQVGDFFELYGEDARTVAELLDLHLIKRTLSDTLQIDMCGFPAYQLEQNVEAIRRSYDVTVSAVDAETKERKIYSMRSLNHTETPLQPSWEQTSKSKVQTFDLHPNIPMAERHNFDLAAHEVEEVGKKERFRRNMEAIRVLKECEFEHRFATPEEQMILSKYVGWGGLSEAFDENNGAWADEFIELYTTLSPDEYESAKESTLTAFYTPPAVISGIYKALEQMGFRTGNLLEPSCGIGNFIGMLPPSMQGSKVYGVELDTISAGIASQLYQQSSIAAAGFEDVDLPGSFFDAVIGNVPFGDFKILDKRYDKYHFLIHDYFFAKSLDKLRPGGILALVTSKGTMDKENPAVRKYIAQRAELLGAIRLPNNTFKGNAGTEVVSDILIFQKRDRLTDIEPDWVHLDTDENGFKMNAYFVQHPEMILGEVKTVSGRFGEEQTVVPYENADLASQIEEAVENIHGEITEYQAEEELSVEDNSIPADPTVRNFSYTVLNDVIYYRENSRMTPVTLSATAENRVKGMIAIRDTVRKLLELQTEDYPDSEIKAEQEKLGRVYDRFTKKYGLINSRGNTPAFSQDSSYSLLSALEVIGEDGQLERKADIFYKRTIKPHTPVTSVETASEALAVSIGEKANIDMEYMSELSGKTEEELFSELKGVIFLNPLYEYSNHPESKYLMADEYLSGNVREKLRIARQSAKVYPEDYTVNVEALEKVQPKDLSASEIFVRLGTTWIPTEIVEQFMFEFLDTPWDAQQKIRVHYSKYTSGWNIEQKSYDSINVKAYSTYGTSRINAYKIIEETLNLKDVRIFDYVVESDGKKKAILNTKETAIAQSKQELIKQGFQDWVWADPTRREQLCRIYNEKFNAIRPREYDGSHITFSGMNPEIELREHQKNAVAHILYGGNTLLAHAVGAGKTYEMAAAAMESKRLGLCNKSLFVVPNHLTEQWAAEFLQLYPAANILVATRKDFETKNRKRFCGRIATGDYDAVIIGHSQFEKIPMSLERQRDILEQELEEIIVGIAEAKQNRGEKFTVKQLQKSKKTVELKLKKLNDQSRKDDVVTFEELGIDRLFVDESHYYKNLFLYTKMRNVGGIAQTEAQKSSDLYMKCRYLDEITGGRGTVFATGTPISNSMVELYTIQRYLQYDTLVQNGLQHFDSWASTFGETVTAVELKPEGTGYRTKTRFSRFYNLPELMSMFTEVADIKTADMLNLPVPQAHYHNIAVKPSEIQKEMVEGLAERAEKVRNSMVSSNIDNMLKITNDGRKLALDQRMINPMLPDFEGSKVNACVDNIYHIWDETTENRSAQLVFCDLSTPKNDVEFSVYTDIRKKLIAKGIPSEEVKFIHEADTEAKKQELFRKVRKGEVRVLLGSTQKMGAGTNCQDRLIALHDIDCPWRPSDLEQRSGRIIRQGNQNGEVDIYRYVTEGTFDAYLYQLIEGKQKFASQIMTSKSPVRSAEDIDETALSYAEIKMLATGNPHIKEKMDLDIQVQQLRLLKSSYLSEKYALEDKIIKYYPQEITRLKETIAGLECDVQTVKEHPKPDGDKYVGIELQGVFYTEKAEAGKAIIDACKAMTNPDPVRLGKYRGFDLELSFDILERTYRVRVRGKTAITITLGEDVYGNLTRIDNAVEKFSERLENKRSTLAETEKQFETAKVEAEKPFSKEEELKAKTARLDELNILLNLDKHENELADDEPDEGEAEPTRKDREQER